MATAVAAMAAVRGERDMAFPVRRQALIAHGEATIK
jgi:hypothetical protein